MGNNDYLNYKRLSDLESLKIEFPRHKQILEESVKLMQTTNNLEVLLRRFEESTTQYNWIMDKKRNGMPVKFETDGDFIQNLNRITNFHLVRIANYQYDKFLGLKSIKTIEQKAIVLFELIEQCSSNLRSHSNFQEAKTELSEIHNKVENSFSKRSTNVVKTKPTTPSSKRGKDSDKPDRYFW